MAVQPDVVIVQHPKRPPTQDNIKQIVEIKFPGDTWGDEQLDNYIQIAGDANKVIELSPSECDCEELERRTREVMEETEDAAKFASALAALMWLITRGRVGPPSFPTPVPAL